MVSFLHHKGTVHHHILSAYNRARHRASALYWLNEGRNECGHLLLFLPLPYWKDAGRQFYIDLLHFHTSLRRSTICLCSILFFNDSCVMNSLEIQRQVNCLMSGTVFPSGVKLGRLTSIIGDPLL